MGTVRPLSAYYNVYTNIYLYYFQAGINIIILLFIKWYRKCCDTYGIYDLITQKVDGTISSLIVISIVFNVFNIINIYMMKTFLYSYYLRSEIIHDSPFYGYSKWHDICFMIYNARRYFWLVACVMSLMLLVTIIVLFVVITGF